MVQHIYWQVKGDHYAFGYTPHRQSDGKFHACKWSNYRFARKKTKDVACAKRRVAKAKAYKWYLKRESELKNRKPSGIASLYIDNVVVSDKYIGPKQKKVKPQPTEQEKKIQVLHKRIEVATKRMESLEKVIKQAETRARRARTKIDKWNAVRVRCSKALENLQKAELDGRTKGFMESI